MSSPTASAVRHGLGSHLQIGQEFHLLASLIERGLLSNRCLHATHSGRKFRVFDIQFDVSRELSVMAARAQVVGTRDGDLADCGQHRLGAQFLIDGLATTAARDAPSVGRRRGELQQPAQRRSAGAVHGRTHSHLDGLQIEAAGVAALLKDHAQQLVYFTRDFLTDRLGRFFSSGVRVSSMGRARQIRSLISSKSWLSWRKR